MASPSVSRRFRLRGEVGGAIRTYVLPEGEIRVGSSPDNDIALPVSGVSRHHAVLRCRDEGVELTDLNSKNGVQVNAERRQEARLSTGDEVRFGPIVLRLEAIDLQDTELAIALGGEPRAVAGKPQTTSGLDGSPLEHERLRLVDRLLPLLRQGPSGLGAALSVLTDGLALDGCCLVELRDRALIVRGAVGSAIPLEERALPALLESAPAAATIAPSVSGHHDPTVVVTVGRPPRALLARGTTRVGPDVQTLLRIVAQLVAWTDTFQETAGAAAANVRRALVFPLRHVQGRSPAMVDLYSRMESIANTDLPILVLGETGVGKEDVARALHLSSSRAGAPLVAVNCAAIPADLLEAELFGVGRGAATGVAPRPGRFQLAHRGTLFLDEIGDMNLGLQAKLLRVLETQEVEPLGSPPVRVDLRVVAATHADLAARVQAGQFRADLYYRLSGATLSVPPLRERADDIPGLVDGILRPLAVRSGKPIRGVTAKALRAFSEYAWPGNVRELEHELQRLLYACPPGEAIEHGMLSPEIRAARPPGSAVDADSLDLQQHVDRTEARVIAEALARADGNRTEAARLLGISRNGLALKMARLDIAP